MNDVVHLLGQDLGRNEQSRLHRPPRAHVNADHLDLVQCIRELRQVSLWQRINVLRRFRVQIPTAHEHLLDLLRGEGGECAPRFGRASLFRVNWSAVSRVGELRQNE